ncbi:MAG: hypothetical protein HEP71_34635 [Roseivirga sp.]|nr:hypothetical protein [Roseivirga sp.]
MNRHALRAKLERNGLKKYADKHFTDETSPVVNELKLEGKDAVIGIQTKDGAYTVLGEKFVYYLTPLGVKGQIPLGVFSDELHENGMSKGKLLARYKYLKLKNGHRIWLKNKSTMCALWNTLLWFESLSDG